MSQEYDCTSGRRSLPSMIAWLSVCLLAAVWGPTLEPQLLKSWSIAGTLGLSCAVALEVAEQTRTRLHERARRSAAQRRLERSWPQLIAYQEQSEVKSRLYDGIRRITGNDDAPRIPGTERATGDSLPQRQLVRVKPIPANESNEECDQSRIVDAYVRDISSKSIGLAHIRPLENGRVVLALNLPDGGSASIVAETQWQLTMPDGSYQSGVTLL